MTPARIAANERIAQLDVLRGLAILFILVLNIPYMGAFSDPDYFPQAISWTALDRIAWGFNRMLDGTQRGLLELLFGAGVLIMARAAMAPDAPAAVTAAVTALHRRRNLWLMVFGILHGVVLLWAGDILLSYGTAALLVFHFRRVSARWLLAFGIAINLWLLAPDIANLAARRALVAEVAAIEATGPRSAADLATLQAWQQAQAEVTTPDPKVLAEARADMQGPLPRYIATMQSTWAQVQFGRGGIYFENIVEAFGTMLIGMALSKAGIIQGKAPRRTYWWLLVAGYGVGLALRIPAFFAEIRFDALPDIGWVTAYAARLPMTLGHIGAVTLALGTRPGARLLAPFEAPGKMPLTVYFSASLTAVVAFGGPFLGLWNTMGTGALLLLALAVIAVQLLAANLWLRAFASGPAEWVWKSLSYAARQPFRRP